MRATTDIPPRRGLPPMVSEFRSVHQQPAYEPLPPNACRLSTPPRGFDASAGEVDGKVTVGVHRSPEEFVSEAISIGHPTRMHSMFPDEISDVVCKCLNEGSRQIAMERTEEIKRWMHLAVSGDASEKALRDTRSTRRQEVLKGKKLCLLRTLLLEAGHDDIGLVDQLTHGFDLTGMLPESNIFAKRIRPAVISCAESKKHVGDGAFIWRCHSRVTALRSHDDRSEQRAHRVPSGP